MDKDQNSPSDSEVENGSFDQLESWKKKQNAFVESVVDIQRVIKRLNFDRFSCLHQCEEIFKSQMQFYAFLLSFNPFCVSTELGYFCVLPPELIHQIFTHLDAKSLFRVCCVSKELQTIASHEGLWSQIVEKNKLLFPEETKPEMKTWKWVSLSRMRIFREKEKSNGPGTFNYPPKTPGGCDMKFSGDWKNGLRDGFGTYYWAPSSLYIGEWKEDKREGHGIRIWQNKNRYEGEYKNHKRHGNGTFIFSNGSIFKGQFLENKFHFGTYKWSNGRVYDGEWDNIHRHGRGKYWWPDGRMYDGQWEQDKRHGHGVYVWPDGDKYEGEFLDGKRWGNGILTRKNGEVYEQHWEENRFDEFNKGILEDDASPSSHRSQPKMCTKRKSNAASVETTFPKQQKLELSSEYNDTNSNASSTELSAEETSMEMNPPSLNQSDTHSPQ